METVPFKCPRCGTESWNPNDLANGYCGKCRWWTADPDLGTIEPPSPNPTIRAKLASQVRETEPSSWLPYLLILIYAGLFVVYMIWVGGPGT